jgi:ssDNA-binding replication factor A large subunit
MNILIVDDSNAKLVCTFWGNNVHSINVKRGDIIAMKGAKVSDYNGK